MLYKDEAVVLRTMRLGEADRIVTFLGRDEGKIRAVAKGIRKTKSRFGARLEPFSRVSLVIWRGKSDLHTVTQVQVMESFRTIREDLDRFAAGEVMLEACDRVVQEEFSGRIFTVLIDGLRRLSAEGPNGLLNGRVLTGFLLRLSDVAGFRPSLDRCAQCDAPAAWFSPSQGGAVCPKCRSGDSEEVGPEVLELMSDILSQGTAGAFPQTNTAIALEDSRIRRMADPELAFMAVRLARFYTEYHLERRLKSAPAMDAFREMAAH